MLFSETWRLPPLSDSRGTTNSANSITTAIRRGVRFLFGAEREGVLKDERPLQALPWVPLVHACLIRAGDHRRMGRLHEHRPRASEQDRDLAMHLPGDAPRPEVPLVPIHLPRVARPAGWTPPEARGTIGRAPDRVGDFPT